jgi:hypothetical protein
VARDKSGYHIALAGIMVRGGHHCVHFIDVSLFCPCCAEPRGQRFGSRPQLVICLRL